MIDRSIRAVQRRLHAATPPNGRRTEATRRNESLRRSLWGGLTLVLIAFLAWFVFWANEAGGILP